MAITQSSSTSVPKTNSTYKLRNLPTLSLELAQHALQTSLTYAQTQNLQVNISIHSASLHLLTFASMDGAKLTSIDIAHNKSFTAAGHRLSTGDYGDRVGPGGGLFGVQHSNEGRFCTIKGGVPVIIDGITVGGIGVSGAKPEEDEEIAQKGVEAILEVLNVPMAKH